MRLTWKSKAKIQKVCALAPGGGRVYRHLQLRFGQSDPDPTDKLDEALRLLRAIKEHGGDVNGAVMMEVGTGYKPTLPIIFSLAGAAEVHSFDLNRYLDISVSQQIIAWFAAHTDEVTALLSDFRSEEDVARSIQRLAAQADDPLEALRTAGIRYHAPADAGATALDSASVDIHYSTTVLEHIPEPTLVKVLAEGQRVVRPDGLLVHLVDMSDHFSHWDPSISSINFLSYDQKQWNRIGGNRFSYCNRLRIPDYERILDHLGLNVLSAHAEIDDRALEQLKDGFVVDQEFSGWSDQELATAILLFVAK